MHRFDLLVVGDANPDVIVGPLRNDLEFGRREQLAGSGVLALGGSGAITAAGATRLGLKVAMAARVGARGGTSGQATWDDVLVHLERTGSDLA